MMRKVDLNEIAEVVRAAGVPAHVDHSGGGCATVYAGGPGQRIMAGPGWFEDGRAVADLSDLSIGPEDDFSAEPVPVASSEPAAIARQIVRPCGRRHSPRRTRQARRPSVGATSGAWE